MPDIRIERIFPAPWVWLTLAVGLAGCAGTRAAMEDSEPFIEDVTESPPHTEETQIKARLIREVERWRGTPYRYGGTGRSGFDCSGFTHRLYKDLFDIDLPRRAGDQARRGRRTTRDDLRVADLVFFVTPSRTDHIGIYLGNGEFAHASTSSGVMISHLDESYWRESYRGARRLVEPVPTDETNVSEPPTREIVERIYAQPASHPSSPRVGW